MDKNTTIYCNCCQKSISLINGIAKEDFLYIRKDWGYFSSKDGMTDEICICEACYDQWIQTLKLPATRTERTEIL